MSRQAKFSKSSKWLTLSSSLLLLVTPVIPLTFLSPSVIAQVTANQLSEEQLEQIARSITVKITTDKNEGSGVLIQKEGQTYTVLTNDHITAKSQTFSIEIDGKTYNAELVPFDFQGKDLALLQFTASEDYTVASLSNLSNVQTGDRVFVAGFPFSPNESTERQFVFRGGDRGRVSEKLTKPLQGGYLLGYTNEIEKGMSGGPILNSQGELIGINGLHDQPLWGNPYIYEDGEVPSDEIITNWRKSSWGIPIEIVAQIAPNYASTITPSVTASVSPQPDSMPKLASEIDQIAEEVSVLVTSSGDNGSGVILAQEGNTYYVLTAKHVLPYGVETVTITTHDGKEHSGQRIQEFQSEGVDLALVQFTSNQSYQVVTIGNYDRGEETNLAFVTGWPVSRQANAQTISQEREFSPGYVFGYHTGNNLAYNQESLEIGNDLIYTNITDEGMSGGPILDAEGRLIGIHTLAEGIKITERQIESPIRENPQKTIRIDWGYSGGISSQRIIRQLEKDQIQLTLNLDQNPPQPISQAKKDQIITSLVSLKAPDNQADVVAWINYGNKLWRLRRYQEAYEAFTRATEIEPQSFEAWYGRGLALVGDKDNVSDENWQKSIEDFTRAKDIDPKSDIAWRQIGDSYWYSGEYQQALAAFQEAIALNPDDFILYNWMAQAYLELGRYSEALDAVNQSIALLEERGVELAENYWRRAITRSYLKDYTGAIADVDKAIEINPDLAILYRSRANFRSEQDNYDTEKVLADYNQSIQLSPNEPTAYAHRGAFYAQIGKREEFKQDFDKAISLDPVNARIYSQRGDAYYSLRETQQAYADYTEAIRLAPEEAYEYYASRGNARRRNGDFEGAIQDYTEALKFRSNYVIAYRGRGYAYAQLGDATKAFQDLDKVVELTPEDSWIYTWRGDAYFALGDKEAGKKEYETAISKSSELAPNFYKIRGDRLKNLDDYQGAISDYQAAISLDPENHSYHNKLAILYHDQKDYDKAIESYTEAIRLAPNEALYYSNRGNSYQELEQYDQALADVNKAISISSEYDYIYAVRGFIYHRQAKYDQAITDYTRAIELNPNRALSYTYRGYTYALKQQYPEAIDDFTQAIALDSENGVNYFDRGLMYSLQGNQQEAIRDLEKSVALYEQQGKTDDPNYIEAQNQLATLRENQATDTQSTSPSPDDAQSYLTLADERYQQEDYTRAVAAYTEAIRLQPDNHTAYQGRALALVQQNQINSAISDLDKALEIQPDFKQARLLRAVLKQGQQDYQGALADYDQALTEPKYSGIGAELGTEEGVTGIIVRQVFSNSPAEKEGLAVGDRIIAVDGQSIEIETSEQFQTVINQQIMGKAGTDVSLKVERDGKQFDLTLVRETIIDPNLAIFYYNRGLLKVELGDNQGAKQDLQTSAELYQQVQDMEMYQTALEKLEEVQ